MGKSRLYSQTIFDLDRIEFIKGTQSTLLGKNASVGAISVVDREPGDRLAANGSAGYEFSNGGYQLDGGADIPIGNGSAIRVAGHYNDLNGWVHNDITGQDGPEHKDLGLRLVGRVKATDDLTVTASYQFNDNRQVGSSTQITGPVPPGSGLEGVLDYHSQQFTTLTGNGDTSHHITSHIASIKGELKLGDNTLISQSAFVHYDLRFLDDLDFNPSQFREFQAGREVRPSNAGAAFPVGDRQQVRIYVRIIFLIQQLGFAGAAGVGDAQFPAATGANLRPVVQRTVHEQLHPAAIFLFRLHGRNLPFHRPTTIERRLSALRGRRRTPSMAAPIRLRSRFGTRSRTRRSIRRR